MKNVMPGHDRPIVCLNAGHSGKANRSPVVPAYYESDMTWKLHNYQAEELEKYGIEVWKTREDQTVGMALYARGQAGRGADLWLSDHSNAWNDESWDYPMAIHLVSDSRTDIDEKSMEIGQMLAKTIHEVMQTKQEPRIWSREAGRDIDGDGEQNDEWYGELRGAHDAGVPALILEHSFHTNKRIAQWLMVDENLRKLAAAEAKTIAQWFDVDKLPEEPKEEKKYIHRIQTGAFYNKDYALAHLENVKAAGFSDAFITTEEAEV